ncbi:MAG: NADP-dependent isocitrate dehydrogenase, partial [Solirubrobacteraceae bacterium]
MRIVYTHTDEAPALATESLLPIVRAFAAVAGVELELRDISLAGRILAQFPDRLGDAAVADALAELGELAKTPEANIIKLPNISASVPQLRAAIKELQGQGCDIPDYPDDPDGDEQRETRARYDRVKGSAVNPVLREGNSDRRAPASVKAYARAHPHSMGAWSPDSESHVSTMNRGDFRDTECSVTFDRETEVRIEHVAQDGTVTVLKESFPVLGGEIVDAAVMRRAELDEFLAAQIDDARQRGVLFSVHLKATMMKVSDPIIFGRAVRAFFPDLHPPGWSPNDGLGALPKGTEIPHRDDRPGLAMVDSDRGITTMHVPSDVIIDASMPAAIRASGCMYDAEGELRDAKFVIPDHSYADLYAEAVEDCRRHGAFDPATMGTTPNVGLMAQKAEEYGSHDKTFEIDAPGIVRIVDSAGTTVLEHAVKAGDIWRACQTKDAPIRDWVALAVRRARATGWPAVFWLDETRAHDAEVLKQVRDELARLDTGGVELEILDVAAATRYTLARARAGENTISVTGNVLRDYLTDLFPIMELGTSAKMLSIVPLLAGGGLFETGAGGSAPKHVEQFQQEGYLRWDSLGEFLALGASLEHLAQFRKNADVQVLADTLDMANGKILEFNRSPARRVGEIDNRGSHFYLALYWAQALAAQGNSAALQAR